MDIKRLRAKAKEIKRIARSHGMDDLRIFGSTVRGTANKKSDVDFLVNVDAGRDMLDLVEFKEEIEALLGLPVDVVSRKGLSPYLRASILREARPL